MMRRTKPRGRDEEYTLALIKPDVPTSAYREVLTAYKCLPGIQIVSFKTILMSRGFAYELYHEHRDKDYFENLVAHMCSGQCVALLMCGKDAIRLVRQLNGATNPKDAEVGTLRARFGIPDGGPKNAVHSSASKEDADRELRLIFGNYYNIV